MPDERKDCCNDPQNLRRDRTQENERPDLVCVRCSVCGCRHFELTVDPGHIGVRLTPVG